MVEPYPTSYRQLLTQREQIFNSALSNGEFEPFVYPLDTLPAGICFLAILLLPELRRHLGVRASVWITRCTFGISTACCVWTMMRCRGLGMGSGYGIGLVSVWGIVWSAVLLLYNDPTTSFRRVETRSAEELERRQMPGLEGNTSQQMNQSTSAMKMPVGGERNCRVYGVVGSGQEPASDEVDSRDAALPPEHLLVWQSYPDDLWHRLGWTADLWTNLRGPGWNWHIPTLPKAHYPANTMTASPKLSQKLLTRIALRDFLAFYLIIDVLKVAVMADDYFWGVRPITSPPLNNTYLPQIIIQTQPLLKFYRLLLSLAAVVSALSFIFSLCPLFFGVVLPLLKLDQHVHVPLREPFLYPPYWGEFTTAVLDKGLAGWWGLWWHQLFRMGMSEPSRVAVDKLGWNARSQKARMLQLVMTFSISGFIHLGASYTTFHPATKPILAPFAFFLSQAFGIAVEQYVFKTIGISNVMRSWPRIVRRAGTLLYVLAWFYLTGPLLVNDFAKSGAWMFEPVPFSLVRGLGWGAEGEGWWCWHGAWVRWWTGTEHTPWWKTGIAIL